MSNHPFKGEDSQCSKERRYLIASQQVGKAVVGSLLGCPPIRVELLRFSIGGTQGLCRFDMSVFESLDARLRIAILLGGHAGGRIGRSKLVMRPSGADRWGTERGDFEMIDKILDANYLQYAITAGIAKSSKQEHRRYEIEAAWQIVLTLLTPHRVAFAIRLLAQELNEEGILDRAAFAKLLEPW